LIFYKNNVVVAYQTLAVNVCYYIAQYWHRVHWVWFSSNWGTYARG